MNRPKIAPIPHTSPDPPLYDSLWATIADKALCDGITVYINPQFDHSPQGYPQRLSTLSTGFSTGKLRKTRVKSLYSGQIQQKPAEIFTACEDLSRLTEQQVIQRLPGRKKHAPACRKRHSPAGHPPADCRFPAAASAVPALPLPRLRYCSTP